MATTNLRQTVTIQELESERETILIDTLTDLGAFMSRKADRKLGTIIGTTDARAYIAEYLKQRLDRMGTLSKGGEAIPAVQLELANAWATYAVSPGFSANLERTGGSTVGTGTSDPTSGSAFSATPGPHTGFGRTESAWTQIKHDASLVQGRLLQAEAILWEDWIEWRLFWNKLPAIPIRAISKSGGWTHWPIWRPDADGLLTARRTTFG